MAYNFVFNNKILFTNNPKLREAKINFNNNTDNNVFYFNLQYIIYICLYKTFCNEKKKYKRGEKLKKQNKSCIFR